MCCQSRWPRWPNLGPPEPEGCGTVVPELWGQGCWSQMLSVLCKQLAVSLFKNVQDYKSRHEIVLLEVESFYETS